LDISVRECSDFRCKRGGGVCIGDPWLDSPQKGFADRSPKTKPGNGVHHKYCLVLFGALQSNAQVWLVGCQ
jgi:hypothetical protein